MILTPLDPRWDDFTMALCSHLNVRDHPDYECGFMSDCDGSYRLCKNLLSNRYKDIDVENTIDYFRKNEWHCDCEVFADSPSGLSEKKTVLMVE